MAKKKKKPDCSACEDMGYLVIQAQNELEAAHGRFVRPERRDLPEIQKCDLCDTIPDDDQAQLQFFKNVLTGKDKLPPLLLVWGKNALPFCDGPDRKKEKSCKQR